MTIQATITYINSERDPYYTACPQEGCNKKVNASMNNEWVCEKCNRSYENCMRRYIMSCTVTDTTGQIWVSAFNDIGEQILKVTADELYELKETNIMRYEEVIADALHKTYLMKVRVKEEMVLDAMKQKVTILKIEPLDFIVESKQCHDLIMQYVEKFHM